MNRLVACVFLVACGEAAAPEAPTAPVSPEPALPVAEAEVAPAPDGDAFDAPLAPGSVAIDVCTLDAVIGVEADGPAVGPIARRGDGTLVVVMDEQLALLRPTTTRDCRFVVTTVPRPGLRGAEASVVADRAEASTVWLASAGTLARLGADESTIEIDRGEPIAHPEGGVWASVGGRWTWIGGPSVVPAPVAAVPPGLAPRALVASDVLVGVRAESLVRVPIGGGARTELGPSATVVRPSGASLVLASPRLSEDVRVLGEDGAELRVLTPGPTVDRALGLYAPVEAPCVLTGLSEIVDGTAYVALETVRDGVRLAVVARIRGL